MPYSPAFQFYPGDYLGDKNTIPMKTVEHGAYDLLWMHCWQQDGIPDDLEELADMAKLPVEEFTPMWNRRIKKCFVWDEKKKRYFHPRLLKEIKKQKAWKKEKSAIGLKGAESRWGKRTSGDGKGMPRHAEAMPTDASSSLSPFPFSSPFSSSDLKRLIDWLAAKNPKKDSRLIEIAVIETLVNRNGATEPINSASYFTDEIKHKCSKSSGLALSTIDAVLEARRQRISKVVQGKFGEAA